MNKRNRIIFIISTALLSALMLFSAGMYIFNYEVPAEMFASLGFPTYIIYPLAVAKILGIIAIWFSKIKAITIAAYAGFAIDFLLASSAHIIVDDGNAPAAIIALVLLAVSFAFRSMGKPAINQALNSTS